MAWREMEAERAFKAARRRRRREALTVHDQRSVARSRPGRGRVREIELARVVGTFDPGRARGFDRRRWLSVWRADTTPPITVMEVGGGYVLLDGHHRVSVALARGERTIPALVT